MPIYEYICTGCRNKFTKLAKMDDAGKATSCPTCGEISVMLMSTPKRSMLDTPLFHGTPHSEDPKFTQQWQDLQEREIP